MVFPVFVAVLFLLHDIPQATNTSPGDGDIPPSEVSQGGQGPGGVATDHSGSVHQTVCESRPEIGIGLCRELGTSNYSTYVWLPLTSIVSVTGFSYRTKATHLAPAVTRRSIANNR